MVGLYAETRSTRGRSSQALSSSPRDATIIVFTTAESLHVQTMSTEADTPRPDILELLEQALDLAGPERRAFLAEIRGRDSELHDELVSILAGEDDLKSEFLGEPAAEAFADLVVDQAGGETQFIRQHPETLGPFRVLSVLGEGGMGCVYLAQQDHPVKRTVAIKLIKAGFTSPGSVARFAAERQAMARLSHPAIAKMLEAGTTDDGFPYFAMEQIVGSSLIEYCDRQRLDVEGRLELFVQICRGVEHAHRKGILHRDLKPSNILVTEIDDRPAPKIIDFGIAKAISGSLTDQTVLTHFGIGTPSYMSPEAFHDHDGDVDGDVDTRTDVYALGIILFQMLADGLPLETRGLSISQVAHRVGTEEPPRIGAFFEGLDEEEQVRIAKLRNTQPRALHRRLVGDLEWIIHRAVEKDRLRRYGSAAELADDIQRHLDLEPVSVGPPTFTYRMGRLARRHPAVTAGATLAVLALALGSVGTTVGMVRARQEAERAALEVERTQDALMKTEEATEFLVELFEVSDPREAGGESTTAEQLLKRGEQRIERRFANQPLQRAELLGTLSDAYLRLNLPAEALRLTQAALTLRRQHLSIDAEDLAAEDLAADHQRLQTIRARMRTDVEKTSVQ